jgi:hypothetical protein
MLSEEIVWGKVFALATCALSIASLPETFGLSAVGAAISCANAAEDWWTE